MTVEEIDSRVAQLDAADDELAHMREDELRADVLRAIADGAESPAELARAALKSSAIKFSRWYA